MEKNNRLVCFCNRVPETELKALLKKGVRSLAEIQQITAAGTSCGRCRFVIDTMIRDFQATHPADPQQKINFDF